MKAHHLKKLQLRLNESMQEWLDRLMTLVPIPESREASEQTSEDIDDIIGPKAWAPTSLKGATGENLFGYRQPGGNS